MLNIVITVDKNDALEKINKASDSFKQTVTQAVTQAAYLIRNTAVQEIQRGGRTGRVYRRRGILHRASAPGEYPKSDTGYLASHIFVNSRTLEAEAGTTAYYGEFLEMKSPERGGRPWLQPSVDKNEKEISAIIDLALSGLFK